MDWLLGVFGLGATWRCAPVSEHAQGRWKIDYQVYESTNLEAAMVCTTMCVHSNNWSNSSGHYLRVGCRVEACEALYRCTGQCIVLSHTTQSELGAARQCVGYGCGASTVPGTQGESDAEDVDAM